MPLTIGTEVAHVTRDSDTTFKVKVQGHQPALLSAALTLEADAAVTVRTYWEWEATATLRPALWHPRAEERGGTYRVAMRTACITLRYVISFHVKWLLICWQLQPHRPM